jgi:hypothetical protein
MNPRAATLCTAALLIAASPAITGKVLPIYIEDNHAGTFYWLAQNVDLDQRCTLILFDAHSDASGIFDSDKIRDALRNVESPRDREALLDRWRSQGAVQCFNWIEPLMPAPITKVIWVPAEKLSTEPRLSSMGTSKRHPGNLDHCANRTLFPISRALKSISIQKNPSLSQLTSTISRISQPQNKKQLSSASGIS